MGTLSTHTGDSGCSHGYSEHSHGGLWVLTWGLIRKGTGAPAPRLWPVSTSRYSRCSRSSRSSVGPHCFSTRRAPAAIPAARSRVCRGSPVRQRCFVLASVACVALKPLRAVLQRRHCRMLQQWTGPSGPVRGPYGRNGTARSCHARMDARPLFVGRTHSY
jgi:hypothetical protein